MSHAPAIGDQVRHASGDDRGKVFGTSVRDEGSILVEWNFERGGEKHNELVPYKPELLLWDEKRSLWIAPRTGPDALAHVLEQALTNADEEPVVARGSIYTRVTCEACGEVFDVEGDATGDTIPCDLCGQRHKIFEVL